MRFIDYLVEAHLEEADDSSISHEDKLHHLMLRYDACTHSLRKYSGKCLSILRAMGRVPGARLGSAGMSEKATADTIIVSFEKFKKTPETMDLYSRYLTAEHMTQRWKKKVDTVEDELVNVKNKYTELQFNKRAANRKNLTQIPETDVPTKVGKSLQGPATLDNPYFKGTANRWAGHPDGFGFTIGYRNAFEMFDLFLTRAGLPGFTLLYGSTYTPNNKTLQNFITYAVDGRLAWRRYYGGSSSPSKVEIFVDGKNVNLNYQSHSTVELKELFPEYFA